MPDHFADRLLDACRTKGAPVCVGVDPVLERLPADIQRAGTQAADKLYAYCAAVIDAVAPHVPAIKPQLACFERYGSAGVAAYERVVERCRAAELLVIADGKRGDIGVSSTHYAVGMLSGAHAADALTVNAYLGGDALQPFVDLSAKVGRGLFALVRTSNPGGDALQGLELKDGRTIADAVADLLVELGRPHVGASGYSLLGAVVGATKPHDARRLRARMPQQLFLVPGYGAQGGGADDVRACFNDDGRGAIITASRSVIYAYEKATTGDWRTAIADAARAFNHEIAAILKLS